MPVPATIAAYDAFILYRLTDTTSRAKGIRQIYALDWLLNEDHKKQ